MGSVQRALRILTVSGVLLTVGACNGGLGSILGSVLGGGVQPQNQSGQINGIVRGVDPSNQQISIQDNSSGQTYWVQYDNRTQVVYRNQSYPATAIRQGDNVTANVQSSGNNTYYTSYVQIN
ncbi:MAG: hypothetical protein NVSMB53_06450 [Gemmatimonadaceae bacterium]